MSHTVKVKVNINNFEALARAAEHMGARVLGMGTHRLFAGPVAGFGIHLKGWNYPLVIDQNGEASYDNYNGAWGDIQRLTELQEDYALMVAKMEADAQGWYNEVNDRGELVIHHPDGGTITVTKQGNIDAMGFTGDSCAKATQNIEKALGTRTTEVRKAEYTQSHINLGENE